MHGTLSKITCPTSGPGYTSIQQKFGGAQFYYQFAVCLLGSQGNIVYETYLPDHCTRYEYNTISTIESFVCFGPCLNYCVDKYQSGNTIYNDDLVDFLQCIQDKPAHTDGSGFYYTDSCSIHSCQSHEFCRFGHKHQCVRGEYYKAFEKECIRCEDGTLVNSGYNGCTACDSGYFCQSGEKLSPSAGYYILDDQSGQSICEAGFKCQNGQRFQCLPGEYQPLSGQDECLLCPENQYCPDYAMIDYQTCPLGNECSGATKTPCQTGEYTPQAGSACVTCIDGSYAVNNGEACEPCLLHHYCVDGEMFPCPLGTEALTAGLSICQSCPAYMYKNENMEQCEQVPDGYTTEDGISLIPCDKGHFCLQGLSEPCEEGHYQDSLAQASCKECEINKYQPDKQKDFCINSAPGYQVLSTGSAKSDPCNFGFYNPFEMASCKSCDAGFFCDEEAMTYQKSCEPGTYQNEQESTFCKDCPLGHYCPTENLTQPILCPSGWLATSLGKISCFKCDDGFEEDKEVPIEEGTLRCKIIEYGIGFPLLF